MKIFQIFYVVMLSLLCANACSAMKRGVDSSKGEKENRFASVIGRKGTPKPKDLANAIKEERGDQKEINKVKQFFINVKFEGLQEAEKEAEDKGAAYLIP